MIVDTLNRIWTDLLAFSATFVTPEWGELIGLLPIFVLIGVVGPIITVLVLAWAHYGFYRPRAKRMFAETRRPALLDAEGRPIYPIGEPYSPSEGFIYEPGAIRSASGGSLVVDAQHGVVRKRAALHQRLARVEQPHALAVVVDRDAVQHLGMGLPIEQETRARHRIARDALAPVHMWIGLVLVHGHAIHGVAVGHTLDEAVELAAPQATIGGRLHG